MDQDGEENPQVKEVKRKYLNEIAESETPETNQNIMSIALSTNQKILDDQTVINNPGLFGREL